MDGHHHLRQALGDFFSRRRRRVFVRGASVSIQIKIQIFINIKKFFQVTILQNRIRTEFSLVFLVLLRIFTFWFDIFYSVQNQRFQKRILDLNGRARGRRGGTRISTLTILATRPIFSSQNTPFTLFVFAILRTCRIFAITANQTIQHFFFNLLFRHRIIQRWSRFILHFKLKAITRNERIKKFPLFQRRPSRRRQTGKLERIHRGTYSQQKNAKKECSKSFFHAFHANGPSGSLFSIYLL